MELNFLHFDGQGGAELALRVNGVARIPSSGTVSGLDSIVKILTVAGTVIVDGTNVLFEADLAPIFQEAGFIIDPNAVGSRRRLMGGAYTLSGYFNFISSSSALNPPPPASSNSSNSGNSISTFVFQTGKVLTDLNGGQGVYNATFEASISTLYYGASWNYGLGSTSWWGQPTYSIREQPGQTIYRYLVRFANLNAYVPSSSVVTKATLTITFINWAGSFDDVSGCLMGANASWAYSSGGFSKYTSWSYSNCKKVSRVSCMT